MEDDPSGLPLLVEIHVDDDVLSGHPAAWPEAAALLDTLGRRAEGAGGMLCFRIREDFARGDRSGFLRGLQARGHEIGWHAHGSRLGQAVAALGVTGVHDAARVGAPGLVQVEMGLGARPLDSSGLQRVDQLAGRARGWIARVRARRVLETAWGLGLRVLTDRRVIREFGWQGKHPWLIDLGSGREIVSLDVTADPFAWGVLRQDAARVHHAHGTLDWDALERLVVQRQREPGPPGYFGLAVHEHNFCGSGSLKPMTTALDSLSRWLDTRGPKLRLAGALAVGAVRPGAPRHGPGGVGRGLATALGRAGRQLKTTLPEGLRPGRAHARERLIPVGGRTVRSLWFHAPGAKGIVVAVHGGEGGCTQRLRFLGLPDDALTRLGWTLVVFDRTEGVPRTPGNPIHVADTAAVLDAALVEARRRSPDLGPLPLHVLTWSGGLVPAVLTDLVGVSRLVDVEGPVDRYSLVPPGKPDHELTRAEIFDEDAWRGREALPGITRFTAAGGSYVRVQGRPDHVHGDVDLHALAAVLAAGSGRPGSARLVRTDGSVRDHGATALRSVVD